MRLFPRKRTSSLSDLELLEAYRKNQDKALIGELYNRYAHLVYGLCLNYLQDREQSRDAVLNLFEKLLITLKDNKPDNFSNWLCFVARNHCISELRKQQVKRNRDEIYAADIHALTAQEEEDPQSREERLLRLENAIKTLGEDQRRCIELFYFGDKSYREIAVITGFSEKEVKSHLQNGKRNLKLALTS